MTSIYHEERPHEGNVTNEYVLGQYGIPPASNRSSGKHTELIKKILQIERGDDSNKHFTKPTGSEMYQESIGKKWSHKCLPTGLENQVQTVYSMITKYTEYGQLEVNTSPHDPMNMLIQNVSLKEEDSKECMLFLKINGIHISLYLSINPAQDSDTYVTCTIDKICGKQHEFDGEKVQNEDFAKACEILLHNAQFRILRTLIPDGVTHLLLQGELAVKAGFSDFNHTDVCHKIWLMRDKSMEEKFRIVNNLEIYFFNVGGYKKRTGLLPEQAAKYIPFQLCVMEDIFKSLGNDLFKPSYARGQVCSLQFCPRHYFADDCDIHKIRSFLSMYKDCEGFILRIHTHSRQDDSVKIFCAKLKEVYKKTEGLAVALPPGHIVFGLIRAGDEQSISGLIVAPVDPRGTTETTITCRQLHIHQFLPRIDPPGCFEGNTMWDAAANAIRICKHGRVIPYEKSTTGGFRRYTFTFGGKSYTLHAQDVGKMNYAVRILSLEHLFTNPEIPSCIAFKANQILVRGEKAERARADTAVFMGLIVPPGFHHQLSRLTRQQQAKILMPPLNDSPFHALKRENKEFFRAYTFGTTNPQLQHEFYLHNLPQDLALQEAFVKDKTTDYSEFLARKEKDVRLMPYHKLLELSIKPRPNANTDERLLARYLASPRPEPAPAQVRREELSPAPVSRAEPARAAVKVSRKRKTADMKEFRAVELASDDLGIDNKQDLYNLLDAHASGDDDAEFEALRVSNPSPQQKLKLTKYYNRKKACLRDHLINTAKTHAPVTRQIEEDTWLNTSARKRQSIGDNVIPFDVPASALAKRARLEPNDTESDSDEPASPEPIPAQAPVAQAEQPAAELTPAQAPVAQAEQPAQAPVAQAEQPAQAPVAQAVPQRVPHSASQSVSPAVSAWDKFKHLIGDKDDNDKDLTLGSGADKDDDDDGLTLGSGYPSH